VRASLVEVLEPSEDRVEPDCPYFERCGGCQFWHTGYEHELQWKTEAAREAIESGAAWARFRRLIEAQGGAPSILDDPGARPDSAPVAEVTVPTHASGYVADLDALSIGQAAVGLGAGRQTKEDSVDPVAGLTQLKKPGDRVEPGEALALLHARDNPDLEAVRARVRDAYTFSETRPAAPSALTARHDVDGWTELENAGGGGV